MKALLKLINTNEDAYKLLKICKKNSNKILHKKHGQELNKSIISEGGFSINFGGYGSFSNLGLGDNFHKKWELERSDKKQFNKVLVCIDKTIDKELVNKISTFIEKNEGEIVTQEKCNLLVKNEKRKVLQKKTYRWERDTAPLMDDLNIDDFIDLSFEELLTKFPSINPKSKQINKLSKETKQNIKNLQKRDLNEIEKTIKNISSDQPKIDAILSGVDVNKRGEIERGTQFKGTKPALSYSDLGLLNLLSISEENSKGYEIRNAITKMDLTVQEIPILKGFDALEHLTLSIINENELTTKDLSRFGEFKNLKTLTIQIDKSRIKDLRPPWSKKKVVISSIDGLKAPKLVNLIIMNLGLSDINSLSNCKELLQLSLDENEELEDINSLTNCFKLQILNLNKTSVKTLVPLREISSLEIISISDCDSLKNLKGLEKLKLKIARININNENRDFDESTLSSLKSLASIENLPKLNSEKLLIREVNISNLKGIESSNHLEELIIDDSINLKDISSLSEVKNLKKIEITTCPKIQDYTVLSELDSLETCLLGHKYQFSYDEIIVKEDIIPKRWPETLKFLRLSTSAICIGDLPKNLQNIELRNCSKIKSLNELKICSDVNKSYKGGPLDMVDEGEIDLSICPSLINLEGLENKPHINKIVISPFITNLDAISQIDDLEITIKFEKIYGFDEVTKISNELSIALSKLRNFKMIIDKGWNVKQVKDISNISSLKNIDSLDLQQVDIEDLSFISTMENLKYIRLQSNDLTKELKRRVFDTEGQIAKLKMKLLAS
mgnify:CR=1 FL=1